MHYVQGTLLSIVGETGWIIYHLFSAATHLSEGDSPVKKCL